MHTTVHFVQNSKLCTQQYISVQNSTFLYRTVHSVQNSTFCAEQYILYRTVHFCAVLYCIAPHLTPVQYSTVQYSIWTLKSVQCAQTGSQSYRQDREHMVPHGKQWFTSDISASSGVRERQTGRHGCEGVRM